MDPCYTSAYETKTKPLLFMLKRYYEKNVYYFRNIKYKAEELQFVIIGFALGRLPLGYFKYTNGNGYSSTVPSAPVEGAEIVTMPNYETFAVYRNGMWEIQMDISNNKPGCINVSSKLVPYIAGVRTVTCLYDVTYEEPVTTTKRVASARRN